MKWFPISELDIQDAKMFVAIAIDVHLYSDCPAFAYTSDPYCVWKEKGKFIRWPHNFEPTHFIYLPTKDEVK